MPTRRAMNDRKYGEASWKRGLSRPFRSGQWSRIGVLCALLLVIGIGLAIAAPGDVDKDVEQFIRTVREDRRLDQIGYVIQVKVPASRQQEDKLLGLTGKFFYQSAHGYLTHVNHSRLERLQKSKIPVQIIDKKRLDDRREGWYLVWCRTEAAKTTLATRFEPLFSHDHTALIRIRPSDEEWLEEHDFPYSLVEEALLPLKSSGALPPKTLKIDRPDPAIQQLLEEITLEGMTATVQRLQEFVSRYIKEPGNRESTLWLADQFKEIGGLDVTTPEFTSYYGNGQNVVAVQKGVEEPQKIIVVCGHFDSTVSSSNKKNAPGADDNGTGTAGVLHLARVAGKLRLPYTVVYACMNAEEVGLIGSKALAKAMAATGDQIQAVLNMDMIADRDDNEVAVIGNTRSNWLIDVFKDAAVLYTGLKSKPLYNSNIWYSDHSSFWNIGVSAILTIEGYPEMSAHYHKVTDTVANLSPEFMTRVARSNLATLLTLNPPCPPVEPETPRRARR
jgi:hypothetical protein